MIDLGHASHESGQSLVIALICDENGFSILRPQNSTRIEIEKFLSHFTEKILLLQEKCIEANLWSLISFIWWYSFFSLITHIFGENVGFVKNKNVSWSMITFQLHFTRGQKSWSFLLFVFLFYCTISFLSKPHSFRIIK